MAIELDSLTQRVFAALEAAGLGPMSAEAWDEQTDGEVQLDDRAHVQVGFDGAPYFMLGMWVAVPDDPDDAIMEHGAFRSSVLEILEDVARYRATGRVR